MMLSTTDKASTRLVHRRDELPVARTGPAAAPDATGSKVLDRVRALASGFRAAADEAERRRGIPGESVDAMLDAGLARVLVPHSFGGYELGLSTWFEVTREIAKADASHGWCAGLMIHNPHYLTYFPHAGQAEMWADGVDFAIAGALPPMCRVEPAEGGYVITGRSPFASGALHSAWAFVGGFLPDETGAPEWSWFLIPAEDYDVLDTWSTIGMRGTGSNVIETKEVFVPHHRILRVRHIIEGDVPGPRPSDNPLYRLPIAAYGPLGFSTAILGAVQGACDEFVELTEARVAPDGSRFAERPGIHRRLAKLAADIDAAELLLRRTVEVAEAPIPPDPSLRARSLRDFAHAAQLGIAGIDEIMAMAGTGAFAETSRLGRAWRDIHFMAANLGISADNNYAHWGRIELGLDRDPGMAIY